MTYIYLNLAPLEQALNEEDQRELARRELSGEQIGRLEGIEKTKAEEEETRRQAEYDAYRAMLLKASKVRPR